MDFTSLIQAGINGLLLGGVYALVAIGLTLIWGVMNIVNFAHGEFMMLAMYSTFWLFTLGKVDPYLSIILNIPLLFLIGVLTQKLLIDRVLTAPHHVQILLTVGLSLFLENMALFFWSPDYRTIKLSYLDEVIRFWDISIGISKLVAFIFSIILAGALYSFLKYTSLGRAMRASVDEKEGALLVGINVKKIYALAFALGCACVGAAGTLVAPFFYIHPRTGSVFVLMAFIVVTLGSMGNFVGALLGGLIMGFAESISAILLPGTLKYAVTFTIFILVLLFKPTGLFGKPKL